MDSVARLFLPYAVRDLAVCGRCPVGGRLRWLLLRDQPLERWVAAQWREVRIDPQPPGGQNVWDSQQRRELVEGLVRLPREYVDTRQRVLRIGTRGAAARHRESGYSSPSFSDRRVPLPEEGEHHAEECPAQGVCWRGAAQRILYLCLEGAPCRVGVDPRPRPISTEPVGLRAHLAPLCSVVPERARREGQQQPLLRVVQDPFDIPSRSEVDQERRLVHPRRYRPEHGLGGREIPLPEVA